MVTSNHSRRPLYALLMSLVLPGFGQLYNGEINKAIFLFLGFALLGIPGATLIALYLPTVLMIPVLLAGLIATLGIWGFSMADAWCNAKEKKFYTLQAWQLGGVYLLIFLLCNTMALPLLIDYVREHQVAAYRIPSASMEPTIMPGDFLFADKRYNCSGCSSSVQRGDVAIFTYPNDRTQNYIKRIIGLPGDRVQIQNEDILVNGKHLRIGDNQALSQRVFEEELDGKLWQVQWTGEGKQTPALDMTVPPGHAFVLGDNRSSSKDTRQFGMVPLQDIVGKARQIWFSLTPTDGVRWNRIGMVVQ